MQAVGRVIIAMILAASAGLSGCRKDRVDARGRSESEGAVRQVVLEKARQVPMENVASVTGTLEAYDRATLAMKVPGRLRMIAVDLGDRVRKGQLIAEVEPEDYQLKVQQVEASVSQARARLGLSLEGSDDRVQPEQTNLVREAKAVLEEARLALERSTGLFNRGLIPKSQIESVQADHAVAESRYADALEEIRNRQALLSQRRSELALARQQLADTRIHAPFDGAIEQRRASVGEFLAAGTPIATLVRMSPLRLRAEIPEREAARIGVGQMVRLKVEGNPQGYTGRIVRLSPSISEVNRSLLVEADVINDGTLRPGAFAQVFIVTSPGEPATAVPPEAILTFAGIEKVIVLESGRVVERSVVTGRRLDGWVEIIEGLRAGEEYVKDPGGLQSGQQVVVRR